MLLAVVPMSGPAVLCAICAIVGLHLGNRDAVAATPDSGTRGWLSAGVARSQTIFGGDHNGATWPSLAYTGNAAGHLGIRFQIQHLRYTDYPHIGLTQFSLATVGPRFWLFQSGRGPYLQALPGFVFSRWSGGPTAIHHVRPAVDACAGAGLPIGARTGLELEAGMITSPGAGRVVVFDAPDFTLDGLRQFYIRIGGVIRIGR
jgi:hypothetical protein